MSWCSVQVCLTPVKSGYHGMVIVQNLSTMPFLFNKNFYGNVLTSKAVSQLRENEKLGNWLSMKLFGSKWQCWWNKYLWNCFWWNVNLAKYSSVAILNGASTATKFLSAKKWLSLKVRCQKHLDPHKVLF